jgi:hypothetical protein
MSRLERTGDFAFGVALLAATPIFVFIGVGLIAAQVPLVQGERFAGVVVRWALLGISFASYLFACKWRKKHRRISTSIFPWEVVTSIICGFGFMFVLVLALWAAGGAD